MANTLVVSSVVGVTPWNTPTFTTTRPRMWFYPGTRLTRAINSWTSPPSNMTGLKSAWSSIASGTNTYAISQALQWLLGGNNPTNLTNAFNAVNGETFSLGAVSSISPILNSVSTPFVLDFCYNGLSTAQKNTLIGQCESFAASAEATFTGTGSLEVANFITDNGISPYAFCILAANGESGFTDRSAKLRNVLQHMQLWYDEISAEGFRMTYSHQVQFNAAVYFAYHIAANEEAQLASRVGFLAGQKDYLARSLNGTGQYYIKQLADHRGNQTGGVINSAPNPAWACAMFADVFQDGVHAWMANQQLTSQPNKWTSFGTQPQSDAAWLAFPFYNSGQTQTTPATAGLPLRTNYPVSGLTNMRATWPNGTGCNAWFFGQACATDSHSTPYGGAMYIWRNDDVLIADGYNYAGRPSGWEDDPVSGNVTATVGNYSMCKSGILFVPSGTSRFQRDASQLVLHSPAVPSGSSGTYPWSWSLQNNRGVGTYLNSATPRYTDNFAGSPPETNTVANLTNAWNNTTQVTKHYRYFSDIPGIGGTGTTSQRTYVIRDQFTAAGGMSNVLINFWCKTKPSITGQTVIQGTSAAGVIQCTGNKAVITSTGGGSQATIQMVSPNPTTVWLVGGGNGIAGAPSGPGYESFFDFDPTTGAGGANLDFRLNFQGGTGDSRNALEYPWIQGQWCIYYATTNVASGGSTVFVITVDAAGTTAPTYNLSQVQTMAPLAFTDFNPTPPGPVTVVEANTPADLPSLGRTLFTLKGANMNTTNDQVFSAIGSPPASYVVNAIYCTNASTSLTTAAGGIWSGLGQTGNNLVAGSQAYSALTSSTKLLNTTLASGATTNAQTGIPVLHLAATQGSVATADFYVLGSDLTAGGASSAIGPPPLDPNGAQWISATTSTISSLDTGRLIYITAWGGNEFGYAFTFALSGAPPGVTIDSDTAYISVSSALSVGSYTFNVIATNREHSTTSNTFPFTLTVQQAVVLTSPVGSAPASNQIAHVTYDPFSGAWGSPSGNNWTTVFQTMLAAIIADQVTCGSEKLHATILLRKGVLYQYTNNNLWSGVQYLRVINDPAVPSGAPPQLQCTLSDPGGAHPYDDGPLNIGAGNAINAPSIKANCAITQSVSAGSSTVTLVNSGDASRIKPGRWHQMTGSCIQTGGFPPNVMFTDYVKVVSVVGTTVTFDRPLKYDYSSTWWEDPADDGSLGVARLVPFDTGGTGGLIPTDARPFMRLVVQNTDFLLNPNNTLPNAMIMLISTGIDIQFDTCTCQNMQLSQAAHMLFTNNTWQQNAEPDKLSETIVIDGCTTAELGQGSGFQYWLFRNSVCNGGMQISPRQFRTLGPASSITGDSFLSVAFSFSFNGPILYYNFNNTAITSFTGVTTWTYQGGPSDPIAIGTDAVWSGNQLQIPRAYANFETWLKAYAGCIVSVAGTVPVTTNWGYCTSVSSDGTGGHLYLNITWVNGSKPLSGNIYLTGAARRLLFNSNNSFGTGTGWADPGFVKQTAAPFGSNWDFPVGYPAPFNE